MLCGFGWRGLRQAVLDNFDGGSDVTLESTGDWTKIAGSATLREDGAGTGYSSSAGIGSSVTFYLNDAGKMLNNRKISVEVLILSANTRAGLIVSGRGSAMKNKFAVYGIRNGANTDYYYVYATGGVDIGPTLIGQIANQLQHTILVIQRGIGKYDVDIEGGTLTVSVDTGGDSGVTNDRCGLYYLGPTFVGGGHQAEGQGLGAGVYAYN